MDHRELAEWHQRAAQQRQDTARHYVVTHHDLKVIEALKGDDMNLILLQFLIKAHSNNVTRVYQDAIWKAKNN